jgi:hypothetical protein
VHPAPSAVAANPQKIAARRFNKNGRTIIRVFSRC